MFVSPCTLLLFTAIFAVFALVLAGQTFSTYSYLNRMSFARYAFATCTEQLHCTAPCAITHTNTHFPSTGLSCCQTQISQLNLAVSLSSIRSLGTTAISLH
eukprot:g81857.t1